MRDDEIIDKIAATITPRDYPEDWWDSDNGRYQQKCPTCNQFYFGSKRRTGDCKLCRAEEIASLRHELRETREMLETAWFIKLDNGGLTRYANQGWSNGNEPKWYDSALAAWRDGVKGEKE